MGKAALLRWTRWTLAAAAFGQACAQSAPPDPPVAPVTAVAASPASGPASTPATPSPAPAASVAPKAGVASTAKLWPQMALHFSVRKPVLGLPLGSSRPMGQCSTDGTTFFDLSSVSAATGATATPDLFSISTEGEVKHLMRKLPMEFTDVSVRDFFVGEHMLVTLLEAVKRDDNNEANPAKEKDYFLSMSDFDGDLSSLVQLDVRFRPLKVALLESGEVLLLGWDENNLMPELAVLKDDGTVRRFVDLYGRKPDATSDASGQDSAKDARAEAVTLDLLQGAAFVQHGNQLLLTYPGSNRPIRIVKDFGDMKAIRLAMPGGYVLHDVLVSEARAVVVVRAKARPDPGKTKKDDAEVDSTERIFEFNSFDGGLVRELTFETPRVSEVTCAARSSLTAIFYQTIAATDSAAGNAAEPPDAAEGSATSLVVSTVRR